MKFGINEKFINNPDIVFFILIFRDAKNFKNNVCKCLVSGWNGFFLSFSFLIIEKRVSKAGYHKKLTARKGDTYEELFTKSITINEIEIAKTYIPESPK